MDSSVQFVDTLKSVMNLNILQDSALICSVAESLRETLKFETDIDVIYSYLNLFALMSSGNHKEWLANTVETLSILLLNRPIIADQLRSRDYDTLSRPTASSNKPPATTALVCDALAEIFLAHINYTAYQAQVVPLEHRDEAVMVTLKQDKQFPVVVKVIQSQLSLVCWGIGKSKKCKKLVDFWFSKSATSSKFHLPTFSSIEPHAALPDIVPEWLVNAAVHSGAAQVMLGMLHHRLRHQQQIGHALTPALAFAAPDFIKAYLQAMNALAKTDKPLVDSWLSSLPPHKIDTMVATVARMHTKVKAVESVFRATLESLQTALVPTNAARQRPNLSPTVIVVSRCSPPEQQLDDDRMELGEIGASSGEGNIWAGVVQDNSVGAISGAINELLGATERGTLPTSGAIDGIRALLKDTKTNSDTVRMINKADYKLLPLLALTFRSVDQASFDFAMRWFRYVFKAYPHIEKAPLWKVVYSLYLAQGMMVARQQQQGQSVLPIPMPAIGANDNSGKLQSALVKSLAKAIHNCCPEDIPNVGPKIDQLTILGLGNGQLSETHCDTVHKLLFASHAAALPGGVAGQFSDYFMSDLLHQSNVVALRRVLHSVLQLQRRGAAASVNATSVLDFIGACVRHPRLQYAVALPASNRHIWPQQNVAVELSEAELGNLLALVVAEAEHLIEQNGPTAICVTRALNKRCRLVDACSASHSMVKRRCAIINRFIEARSQHSFAVEKFSFALYSRLPALVAMPLLGNANDCLATVVTDSYSVKEVHRIGQRLLAGLVNPRLDLQDLANQSCKALVSRHPRLCVQLLPFMCALSDGALDGCDSWMDFRRKRGQSLYSNLLHLLEIMAPYSLGRGTGQGDALVRAHTKRILENFLRVLIRYREQHVFFMGFATRLVAFLERKISTVVSEERRSVAEESLGLDDNCGNGSQQLVVDNCGDFLVEHAAEIGALSKVFTQFRSVTQRCGWQRDAPTPETEPDDARVCQMPLLKLEYLATFRRKLRDTHSGNGVLVLIRDLDEVSKRETNIIGLFLDDLRALLGHSMTEVRLAAVQVLARYLNAFPEQAARFVSDCVGAAMLKSGCYYWARPFANLALKTLCQVGMLAPGVVPACLANHARLLVAGNNGRGSFRESIELLEVIIDNASLESFMESSAAYNCKPLLKKDVVTTGQKRHYQDNTDGEGHKAKRSRYK